MEIANATGFPFGYTLGRDADGREWLVVAVKGTFDFPSDGGEAARSEQQVDLVPADTFSGEPGFSAPVLESDYAPIKPKCDVLLNGSAHAPRGRGARKVSVSLSLGPVKKQFDVVGERRWRRWFLSFRPSRPRRFTIMPISYDRAYGGIDDSDPKKVASFPRNPAGCGYQPRRPGREKRKNPVPNTQAMRRPIRSVKGNYAPMSFGPVGRSWSPRLEFAGTYDGRWLRDTFPFLPADFDERYFQAAPSDQQIPYPSGGEPVILRNLTAEGRTEFRLPTVEVPVEYTDVWSNRSKQLAVIDTVFIESDLRRLSLVWRCRFPVRRNLLEGRELVIGDMSPAWYAARDNAQRDLELPILPVDAGSELRS